MQYAAKAFFRADGTVRLCRILIDWLREDFSRISTIAGPTLANFTTAFREISVAGIAPAETSFASIVPAVDGVAVSGEGHFVDKVQLAEGDATLGWADPSNPGLVLTGSGVRIT